MDLFNGNIQNLNHLFPIIKLSKRKKNCKKTNRTKFSYKVDYSLRLQFYLEK